MDGQMAIHAGCYLSVLMCLVLFIPWMQQLCIRLQVNKEGKGDRLQLRKLLSATRVSEAHNMVEVSEFNVLQLKDDSK